MIMILGLGLSTLQAQVLILNPLENTVFDLHHIAVTVMGKPNAKTTLYLNDELISQGQIRVDGVYDFLNISTPDGPVTLRVEAEGSGGKVYVSERKIHVLGPPKKMIPFKNNISIPADGQSTNILSFEFQDEWGYTLSNLKIATVSLTHGPIVTRDLDKSAPGVQIPVVDGGIEFEIKSPKKAVRAMLEVNVLGEIFQMPIRFTTPQESFMLVGSLSGALSNYQDFPDNENEPDVEMWREHVVDNSLMGGGRAAFYAKGNIFNNYQLTASFDSKRNYKDQFYKDIDPSEQYAVYGDASSIEYDAQSNSEFYVKLAHNESSLLYGDYDTKLGKTEFTAYNRTFNGFIADLHFSSQTIRAFATLTDREMQLDEIRGEGISGYYYLSNTYLTDLSEKIIIQTRDKYHSELIVASEELIRYQDYMINYEDASLMFKQPVPSIDENGNPVYIVVSYEYQSGARETAIAGVRYDGLLFKKLQIGGLAVLEEKQTSNYYLYGVDAKLPLFSWLALKGEFGQSINPDISGINSIGNAYKVEMQVKPFKALTVDGYYRNVDSTFVNMSQSGKINETGSQKYGVKAKLGDEKFGQVVTEYYKQFSKLGTINENSSEVFNVTYKQKFLKNGLARIAFEDANRVLDSQDTISHLHSRLIKAGVEYKLSKKISAIVEREQNLEPEDQSKPTFTGVGLKYAITEKIGIFGQFKRLEGENEGNQIVFGIDSKVKENTELSGKYEIGGASGDDRNRATIGFKNKWSVTKDLTFNFAYENVSTSDAFATPTIEHQALSTSFEFLPTIPFKITGKVELLSKTDSRQYNTLLNVDFKIAHGLSFLAKSVFSNITYFAGDDDYVIKSDNQLGLAIRPERSDYFNSLLKVAYLVDQNTHVQTKINEQRLIIYSHNYWQPMDKLEVGFSVAHRMIIDEEVGLFKDKVTTNYFALRLEYDLNLKWYTAADLRFINIQPINERKVSSSIEVGYQLMKNMQIGLGYALSQFDDPDFASENYMFNNFFLTFHMKFSDNMFNWK